MTTNERSAAIVALYRAGWTQQQIGDAFGVSKQSIGEVLHRNGIRPGEEAARRARAIVRDYKAGAELEDLAQRYAASRAAIRQVLWRNGIAPRRRPSLARTVRRCHVCGKDETEVRFTPSQRYRCAACAKAQTLQWLERKRQEASHGR